MSRQPLPNYVTYDGRTWYVLLNGAWVPVQFTEPSKMGWAGIGMGLSFLGALIFGALTVAGYAAAAPVALLFTGSFTTTLGLFAKDRLITK